MDLLLLLARLVLAAVFAVAGIAKLADLPGSRRAAAEFGVSPRLTPAIAILLPLAEIAIAVTLLPTGSARWGALGALVLLGIFIAAIGLNLARGRTPDCHCFGQLHSTPAGWPTIARNSVLAVVAALVARGGWRDPGYSAIVWLTGLSGAEAGLLIGGLLMLGILAALGWIVVNLMSQHGRLLGRLESLEQTLSTSGTLAASSRSGTLWSTAGTAAIQGLPIGTSAPVFALPDLDGAITTLDTLRAAGAPVLLLFSDPACGPCNQLMREAGRWQREYVDQMAVVLVSRGSTREANLAKAREYGLERVLLQQDREVAQAYEAQRTPTAVIVRTDGTIGTALVGGIEAVRALVTSTLESGKIHHVSNGNPRVPSLIESWSR